ncbi:MAG TPA: HAD-IIIC family phosphatase [Patescibacteria group bacterium]|nr:HAD-IIIC family phosphatase [Patescibacteria group bacterium]
MANIKCVIWDLDNTLWDGICLEDPQVRLKPGITDVLGEISRRGIVQSIASKNEPEALRFVEKLGLADYFVYPHVNWNPKEENIRRIVEILNIGLDAAAFVDDNPFERESVAAMLPEVRTYDAADYMKIIDRPEMQLKYDTPEARSRGRMYVDEAARQQQEKEFEGRRETFLLSLGMKAFPCIAVESDLGRICELVTRTNQFNSTGIRYSDDEIRAFYKSDDHEFHIVSLTDKYGDYGRCGVALIRKEPAVWNIEILLVSCRVAGRGLGTAFLSYLTGEARKSGCTHLRAKYIKTDRNRQIGLLYKIVGFDKDREMSDETASVFTYRLDDGPAPCPEWIRLEPCADERQPDRGPDAIKRPRGENGEQGNS